MKHHPPRPHRLILFTLLFAAVASVSAGAQTSATGAQPATNLQEHLRHSTALIERVVPADEAANVRGLGVYLREDVLATSRDAIRGAEQIRALTLDGRESFEITGAVCIDEARDLILLRVAGGRGRPPEFADPGAVRAGDPVTVVAAQDDRSLLQVEGRVKSLSPIEGYAGSLLTVSSPPLTADNAESVVLDAQGRPLGVFIGRTSDALTLAHLARGGIASVTQPEQPNSECAEWLAGERDLEKQRDARVAEMESQRLQSVLRPMLLMSMPPPRPVDEPILTATGPGPRPNIPEPMGSGRPPGTPPIIVGRSAPQTSSSRSVERMSPPPPITSQPPATSTSVTEVREEYAVVRVFYGTDRRQTGSHRADKFYGGARSKRDTYEAGVCDVSIPKTHKTGKLEAPSILRLEFRADPARHVILQSVTPLAREEFFSSLRERFEQTGGAHALVFIHGFNVTFEDAARRTAQIAYDLGFNGVPLMYSWPSRGSLLSYRTDETSVELAVPHLKQFLEDVAAELGPGARIHLIAHSMGNRALTNALRGIAANERPSPLFNQVILTAPDIDADVFLNEIAPAIQKTAAQVTLYASSDDKALAAGRRINGKPRAGESGDYLLAIPGIVTVDASGIDTSLLGHSYYAELKSVLDDIDAIMRHGYSPAERKLRALTKGTATYWSLVAAATATTGPAVVVPGQTPQVPGGISGGTGGISLPALLLVVALVLAAVLFFVWRLIRRRRGAGSIHS